MTFEVYKVTHRASGKAYIGCTTRGIAVRWKYHIYDSKSEKRGYLFQSAIAKYGEGAFDVSLLETVNSLDEMFAAEIRLIAEHNTISPNGYNLTGGGDGACNPSQETREKLRKNALGNSYFGGCKHSEETKKLMSLKAVRTVEHRAAISKAQKAKIVSAETRMRISASKKGKTHAKPSAETIEKYAEARRQWWARARESKLKTSRYDLSRG